MDVALAICLPILVVATAGLGLVAAAETALERANDVRIQALAARGEPGALRIAGDVTQPAAFLAPLTVARVLLAAIIVTLGAYLGAHGFGEGGALGFGLLAGLYVAVVQLTVGLVAARQPEYVAISLSRTVKAVAVVFAVPAWLLGLPSRMIARSIRVVKPDLDRDILALVEREEAAGGVEEMERRMIRGVITLEDKSAREIMVPRIDIVAADIESGIEDVARLVTDRGFSRIPIYRESIDEVVGIAYAKDLLRATFNGGRTKELSDLLRKPVFIPESKRVDELLKEMQATRTHLAIVVDEYGGTAGLVSIEDLLEEIVGEIEDEYDVSAPRTEVISEDEALVDGGVTTDILKDLFGYEVESEDFDTVGGLVMNLLGRLPAVGDEVQADGLRLRVLSMSGRRVKRMRVARETAPERAAEPAGR